MSSAMVSLSLPHGVTVPVRTSAAPAPPSWPPLPDVQHSGGIVFFHPLHIDDIADVQQNRNTLERAANLFFNI